jgi:hypothetical protein
MNSMAHLHPHGNLAMTSILCALLVGSSTACGSSSAAAVAASPPADSITQNFVALAHSYWVQIQTADQVSNGSNVAALVCLGKASRNATSKLPFVDAPACRARAVAILAVQKRFLSDLDTTPPPVKFAAEQQTFESQVPKAITDVNAMIVAADSGNKDAVLEATSVYVNDMIPTVTDALDKVDPSVVHN